MGFGRQSVDEWNLMLKNIDTDGDGNINYTEFITAAMDREILINQDNLKAVFNLFDQDGNGLIEVKELKDVFEGRNLENSKDEKLWRQIMEEVDLDKDNYISFDEFATAMNKVCHHEIRSEVTFG